VDVIRFQKVEPLERPQGWRWPWTAPLAQLRPAFPSPGLRRRDLAIVGVPDKSFLFDSLVDDGDVQGLSRGFGHFEEGFDAAASGRVMDGRRFCSSQSQPFGDYQEKGRQVTPSGDLLCRQLQPEGLAFIIGSEDARPPKGPAGFGFSGARTSRPRRRPVRRPAWFLRFVLLQRDHSGRVGENPKGLRPFGGRDAHPPKGPLVLDFPGRGRPVRGRAGSQARLVLVLQFVLRSEAIPSAQVKALRAFGPSAGETPAPRKAPLVLDFPGRGHPGRERAGSQARRF
jgi:hypothetical protein